MRLRTRVAAIVAALVGLTALDQVTKALAEEQLRGAGLVEIIGRKLYLIYAENTGAFLSLGAYLDEPLRIAFLIVLPLVAVAAAVYYALTRVASRALFAGIAFIAAGGAGNLVDRIFRGSVRDFLKMDFVIRTGVMNLADLYVLAGVILVVVYIVRSELKKKRDDALIDAWGAAGSRRVGGERGGAAKAVRRLRLAAALRACPPGARDRSVSGGSARRSRRIAIVRASRRKR